MKLTEISSTLQTLLAKDAKLAAIPFLGQVATAVEDQAAVQEYNKALAAALAEHGLAFVAIVAEGTDNSPDKPILDLHNMVILSVIENPKTNQTGETCYETVSRALPVLKRGQVLLTGARAEVNLGKPAYNVGPLNRGNVVYFINLLVRTTENLGPVTPA